MVIFKSDPRSDQEANKIGNFRWIWKDRDLDGFKEKFVKFQKYSEKFNYRFREIEKDREKDSEIWMD